MCCCATPNVNGQPGYSWDGKTIGTRRVDPPELSAGDVLLFDEPGRCGGLDSHCHHYRVVRGVCLWLLVRHGGGDDRVRLTLPRGLDLTVIPDTMRYWLLNTVYHAYAAGKQYGTGREGERWRTAAAEGRIKVRKVRGQPAVRVSIDA